jgi:flavin reductase (DIM6/NTAB) family NADH-FMN oxidoreductase RutF
MSQSTGLDAVDPVSPDTVDAVSPDGLQVVSPDDLRLAFRRHAAGVVVITAPSAHGPVGFTATSLTSVSAAPALVSFNIGRTSSSWAAVQQTDRIAIHVLAANQRELAATFARSGADRFAEPTRWIEEPDGLPLLPGCPVRLVAAIENRWPAGDHCIVVARVLRVDLGNAEEPLLYHGGSFYRLRGGRPDSIAIPSGAGAQDRRAG